MQVTRMPDWEALAVHGVEAVRREMSRSGGEVFGRARAAWPVKTGFSRDNLYTTTEVVGAEVVTTIGNRAPYAAFIGRVEGRRMKDLPSQTLLLGPVKALGEALPHKLAAAVAAAGERK